MSSPPNPNQKRGRPRNPIVQAAILKTALELLSEGGLENLTYGGVAARAKVGKPTIYLRWKHKEDLAAEAIESWRPALVYADRGNLRDNLLQIAEQFHRHFSTPTARQLILVTLSMLATEDTVNKNWWVSHGVFRLEALRTIFRQGVNRGELNETENIDTLMLLFSAFLMHQCLFNDQWQPYEINAAKAIDKLISPTATLRPRLE